MCTIGQQIKLSSPYPVYSYTPLNRDNIFIFVTHAMTMKISVFWDVAPCSAVDCNSSVPTMDAPHSSETSIIIWLAVRRHLPEDSDIQRKLLETSSCIKQFQHCGPE